VHRDTRDLDEEMERVFPGVSSEADPNRFELSRFSSDRSPRPGNRRFSEDDYTGIIYKETIIINYSNNFLQLKYIQKTEVPR